MHCALSVVMKSDSPGSNANPPASRSNVRTTVTPAPYRTLCISYRSMKSRDALVLFAGSLMGLQCQSPINFVGNSSSPSSQE